MVPNGDLILYRLCCTSELSGVQFASDCLDALPSRHVHASRSRAGRSAFDSASPLRWPAAMPVLRCPRPSTPGSLDDSDLDDLLQQSPAKRRKIGALLVQAFALTVQ